MRLLASLTAKSSINTFTFEFLITVKALLCVKEVGEFLVATGKSLAIDLLPFLHSLKLVATKSVFTFLNLGICFHLHVRVKSSIKLD
jgi:hypothetical protein